MSFCFREHANRLNKVATNRVYKDDLTPLIQPGQNVYGCILPKYQNKKQLKERMKLII